MQTTNSQPLNRFEDLLTRLPLAWISVGFLAGVLLADQVTLAWFIWLIAAGVMLIAALLGALASVVGLYVSYYANVVSGAAIVLSATAFFLIAWLFNPRQGVLRRTRAQ